MAFVGKRFVNGYWRKVYLDAYGLYYFVAGRKVRLPRRRSWRGGVATSFATSRARRRKFFNR